MPPKKEPKEPKKADAGDAEPEDEEKEMLERELTIGLLKNRLGKYENRTAHLTGEYTRLAEELESQKLNLKDINGYLTNELAAKDAYCMDLERQTVDFENSLEQERANALASNQKMLQEMKDKEEALREEIAGLETKLKELSDFSDAKFQLEQDFKDLKALLNKEQREHVERISDLERKAVQEKDRLKKEMAQKIKETKQTMEKLTDNQLETTTKRTIMENEQMASELAYQSRQTENLLAKNKKLLEDNLHYKQTLELSQQTEAELAKRNHVYQKTIKTLLAKLKQQDAAKRDDEEELSRQIDLVQDMEARANDLEDELNVNREEMIAVKLRADHKTEEAEVLREQQDEVARFLITCLSDVKKQIVTVVREHQDDDDDDPEVMVLPGKLDELNLEQRERAICYLLEKLHAFQSSKQLRLLGLHRNHHNSLPPISGRENEGYGGSGAASKPTKKGAGNYYFPPKGVTLATQTTELSSVVLPNTQAVMSSQMLGKLNQSIDSNPLGEARGWGRRADSLPLSSKGSVLYLKQRKQDV
mmetsp:Transcript_46176/g.76941  ORF Transcript_46176/g.76941 Transcript_46176/m.76941 type:complete len:534 (-) Transcript_46176:917-2518(-)|eukprot:CAMPEP_0198218970 /NCGR_PEP_ID=MMETSP1445-20131203/72097_1 /TAXON_ID=36898 /ORGANISM="Pyramimonas sp., Strain CCMP2087" /LENGTH=533 /DNA_ID=CAMNT_0043896239 /DNA_START=354 /DNA_END=1955 /DNA_ORIENTATION=+